MTVEGMDATQEEAVVVLREGGGVWCTLGRQGLDGALRIIIVPTITTVPGRSQARLRP